MRGDVVSRWGDVAARQWVGSVEHRHSPFAAVDLHEALVAHTLHGLVVIPHLGGGTLELLGALVDTKTTLDVCKAGGGRR